MAIAKVQVTGKVVLPGGVVPRAGSIVVTIHTPGVTDDGEQVVGAKEFALGADGSLPADFTLTPNAAITPQSWYDVEIRVGSRGVPARLPVQKWSIVAGVSPIAIDDVLRIDGTPSVVYGPDQATLAARDAALAAQAGAEAAESGAAAAGAAAGTAAAQAELSTKVTAAGGDASATVVTATGGAAARPLADLARDVDGYTAAQVHPLLSKIKREIEDAVVLVLGDSTGTDTKWVYQLVQMMPAMWPTHTIKQALWNEGTGDYDAATTVATGTGARTLTVYNASISGSRACWPLGGRWAKMVQALTPDLVFVNYGHNQGNSSTTYRSDYLTLTESVTEQHPGAGLVLILQNPASADGGALQGRKASIYEAIAQDRGYGTVNVWQAFIDYGPTWGTDLLSDGVHPNLAGSLLWANAVKACMAYSRSSVPRGRSVSSITLAGRQLLNNGDFSQWDPEATYPVGWLTTGAPTVTRDTVNYEGPNGYAVKVATSGAMGGIRCGIPLAVARGRWVTVLARVYAPEGGPDTAGVVALYDGAGMARSTDNAQGWKGGAFRWVAVSKWFPTTAAQATVYLYGDLYATSGWASFDHVSVVVGTVPLGRPDAMSTLGLLSPSLAAAGTKVLSTRRSGVSYDNFYVTADGLIYMGLGTATAVKALSYIGTALQLDPALKTMAGRIVARVATDTTMAITAAHDLVTYTGSGGHSLTLPTGMTDGRRFIVKNAGTGSVTLQRGGSNTLEKGTSVALDVGHAVGVHFDSSGVGNWEIVSEYHP